jgi:hypothetical protein
MGPRSFHVGSTLRQFRRYKDALFWANDRWRVIVDKAIETLAPLGSSEEHDYPDTE